MYAVRLHFKNGTMLGYVWADMGAAHKTKDLCARAMLAGNANPPRADGAICEFWDEAGREAHVDGADLSAVQFVDIEAEVTMDFEANMVAEQARRKVLLRHGIAPPAQPQPDHSFETMGSALRWPEEDRPAAPRVPSGGINRFEG